MQSDWITHVNAHIGSNTSGVISDGLKLEWRVSDITSPDLALLKKSVCEVAGQDLAATELEFLKAYPKAVHEELFLKSCEPYFREGVEVDWVAVAKQIEATIKQFYSMDLSKFGPEMIQPLLKDIYFYVKVKESDTDKLVGFLMSAITPALPFGNVKVINLWVAPSEHQRGISKLLIDSILKIIPDVKRIYLLRRPTNIHHLESFTKDLNFQQDPNHKVNLDYFIPFEYII